MEKVKKINLSLGHMIVQEDDRPYEVPENWVWTRLENFNRFVNKSIDPRKFTDKMFELYSVPSFENNYPEIISGNDIGSIKQNVSYGDVLLCKINPRINRVWIVSGYTKHSTIASSEWIVITNSKVNGKYLMYCLKSKYFREFLLSNVSGVGGSLMRAQPKYIKKYPIPLAPLKEQQRIVNTIESLFEKLDRAKELVQNALDSFENRKAAILHKAFTGDLTAKWRLENGVSLDDWEENKFGEIAEVKSNLVDPKDYLDFPHIAPNNIRKRTGELLEYRTIKEDKVKSGKHKFYSGQILYSKIRPYLSKIIVVNFDGLCSADMYPIETSLDTRFLWYYMLSDDFVMYASSAGSRSVLPKINQKELAQLKVIVPPVQEQKKIVKILDKLLDNEQQAKDLCNVIEKIDLMKKSILSKAFRGELGTNNPEEESAIWLLREIINE
jgi:type I restriction enzyme S subunit